MNWGVFFRVSLLAFLLNPQWVKAASGLTVPPYQYGFIQNRGQCIDQFGAFQDKILFVYQDKSLKISLNSQGWSYEQFRYEPTIATENAKQNPKQIHSSVQIHRIDFHLINSNPNPLVISESKFPDPIQYYTKNSGENGLVQTEHFGKITYKEIYPKIDLVFSMNSSSIESSFKYNFILHPGADIKQIKFRIDGAQELNLLVSGEISMRTSLGEIKEQIPYSYSYFDVGETEAKETEVMQTEVKETEVKETGIKETGVMQTEVKENGVKENGAKETGVMQTGVMQTEVKETGIKETEVMQTEVKETGIKETGVKETGVKETGAKETGVKETGVKETGIKETGVKETGAKKQEERVKFEQLYSSVFGFKMDATILGKTVVIDPAPWLTYCGSLGEEIAMAVLLDSSENLWVAGYTNSSTNMVTSGAHQTIAGGLYDGYLAKYNALGVRQWSSFLGGSNSDYCTGLSLAENGQILVVGTSESGSGIASVGAAQDSLWGMADAFVAKFSSAGLRVWGTYLGGEDYDYGNGIVRFNNGSLGVCGGTFSMSGLATTGAYDTLYAGGIFYGDAFVVKLNASGQKIWGTYLGGSGGDNALAIALDSNQNLVTVGFSMSATGLASNGSHQTVYGGNYDGFMSKFSSNGALWWSSYYGGLEGDYINAVCLDKQQNILIAGRTLSDSLIATSGTYQSAFGGGMSWGDSFLAKFSGTGMRLWSTYFGGSLEETAQGISVDSSGQIFICGSSTGSSGFSTTGVQQSTFGGGGSDGYLAKFSGAGVRIWCTYLGGINADGINALFSNIQGQTACAGYSSSAGLATFMAQQTILSGAPDMILGVYGFNGVLPVQLIAFSAQMQENGIACQWSTSSEINNAYFNIEKSGDALIFDSVGWVTGMGNSAKLHKYFWLDQNPFSGNNYYRLKQVDFDGQTSLSEVVLVTDYFDFKENGLQIKPNPSKGIFYLQRTQVENDIQAIEVYNMHGSLVKKSSILFVKNNWSTLNLEGFCAGLYYLKIGSETKKIMLE
ncbi:MAG: SBBP repeat-containing protein [bacterium]|nr:SBBP repeat-containing protein [bacterium]